MKEMNEIMTEISFLFQIFVCSVLSDFHSFIIGVPHFCNKSYTIFVTKKTGLINPVFDFIFCKLSQILQYIFRQISYPGDNVQKTIFYKLHYSLSFLRTL